MTRFVSFVCVLCIAAGCKNTHNVGHDEDGGSAVPDAGSIADAEPREPDAGAGEPDAHESEPDAGGCSPIAERCDAIDDDCDGAIDEDQPLATCERWTMFSGGSVADSSHGTI